jgi:hypothetical protein
VVELVVELVSTILAAMEDVAAIMADQAVAAARQQTVIIQVLAVLAAVAI